MNFKVGVVYGVGVSDADYQTQIFKYLGRDSKGKVMQKLLWICPYYHKWKSMLERCYSSKLQEKHPSYVGCYVCDEWLTFSNFRSWMETQDWEGNQLDKDLLYRGNKVYSPNTCIFVHKIVNSFLTYNQRDKTELLVGVGHNRGRGKPFIATCNDPLGRYSQYIGLFNEEQDAHDAWFNKKRRYAIDLSNSDFVKSEVVREALLRYFEFKF